MSKLQKAIRAARNLSAAQPEKRATGTEYLGDTRPEGRSPEILPEKLTPVNDSSAEAVSLEDFREIPVTKQLNVDLARVSRFGFWPLDDKAALPQGQFGRAKRPIIHNAFETRLPIGEHANVLMVGSAMPGAGKTFSSINLARSIARERDVGALLIDGDVLKSGMTESFGCRELTGLMDYLLDDTLQLDDVLYQTDVHGIVLVPAGSRHPEATELLSSRRMKQFIQEVSARFKTRVIICDTPPLLITDEAYAFVDLAGQILLVIESGSTSIDALQRVLGSMNCDKPINAILNKAVGIPEIGYYGEGYGSPKEG